jgi:thiamine transporter ThiT
MTSPSAALRLRPARSAAAGTQDRERRARRKLAITWGLLFLNALTFYPGMSFIHIPSALGKVITQAALGGALLMALAVNRRRLLRPNVFLCLLSLLVLEALVTTLNPEHWGTIYRTFRLGGFVVTLWLLTPWWGRRDLLLVRYHLGTLITLLGSVLLGLVIAPSHALVYGRLTGAVWPIPPTEVAHYAAVATGLVIVLWLNGYLRGRVTLSVTVVAVVMLVLTHTRTAIVAMVAGVLVAGLSLVLAKARARKLLAAVALLATVAVMTLSGVITSWLARGESSQQLNDLTGRTTVWSGVVTTPRDRFQVLFGFGLSNKSFNGLPIDSNWLASYNDQGLLGVSVCAAILIFLLVKAYFHPHPGQRALALFLTTYCLLASFTEVGFMDVSPYMLEVTLAASLLVLPAEGRSPP